jgi:hypothetical protein
MGKQRTVCGAYTSEDLGKDATGPLKATEMDRERSRHKSVADGESYAARIDEVSTENCGLAGKIRKR